MELRRARFHALASVDDGAQRGVFNVDQFERVLSDITILRDDHGDGVADVADFRGRNRRLLRALQAGNNSGAHRNGFQSRHVGGRQDADDAGEFQRSRRIYFDDARMRVRAPQNRGMHHAGAVNIADIFADAAQKPHVFFRLTLEPM